MSTDERMVYWRQIGGFAWRFGYRTPLGNGLVRMGCWNGDTMGGSIVSEHEIETKPFQEGH